MECDPFNQASAGSCLACSCACFFLPFLRAVHAPARLGPCEGCTPALTPVGRGTSSACLRYCRRRSSGPPVSTYSTPRNAATACITASICAPATPSPSSVSGSFRKVGVAGGQSRGAPDGHPAARSSRNSGRRGGTRGRPDCAPGASAGARCPPGRRRPAGRPGTPPGPGPAHKDGSRKRGVRLRSGRCRRRRTSPSRDRPVPNTAPMTIAGVPASDRGLPLMVTPDTSIPCQASHEVWIMVASA